MVLTGLQTEALFRHLEDIHENDELEFKAAKGGLPRSFWETYSSVYKSNQGTDIPTNVDTSVANVDTSAANVDTSVANVDTYVFSERLQAILKKRRFSLHEMIFAVCEISSNWISIQQMAQLLHKDEKYLKNTIIPRLLGDGVLVREFPLTPNHPYQRYKKSNG